MRDNPAQNGSALIYVFVGVLLFAALVLSFSRGMQQTPGDVDTKTAKVVVTEFLSYGNAVQGAIEKLARNGCSEQDLKFYHPDFDTPTDYSGQADYLTPPNNKCHIFDPDGGHVKWQKPSQYMVTNPASDYLFSGVYGVQEVGNSTCPDTELMMILKVNQAFCLEYNNALGIENPNDAPPQQAGADPYGSNPNPAASAKFGSSSGTTFGCGDFIGGVATPELTGKTRGCYQSTTSNSYYAYYVLLSR